MQNHTLEICLALGVLIPLLSFTFLAFWGPTLGKPKASFVALAAIVTCCGLATFVLVNWYGMDPAARIAATANTFKYHWGDFGDVPIRVGVKLDSLTVIMFFMVTFIASFIHLFSIGYMAGHSDEVDGKSKYHRFFAYLSLFCFSMLGLVISSSLLFLFIFWELVGLCSYLLIGFYFDRKYASNASMKAFITNRVGDFGFIIGLAMVVLFTKTFDLDDAAKAFADQYRHNTGIFATAINLFGFELSGMNLATLMGIGLFCGAMGKSAQFPLHVWLPDAMAGPTPVSALIHAATMVAAGVYLVARVFRLLTPDAQFFIAVIGIITLTMTALIAVVQTDIKKVLAYSTLSQLGYMVFGMGVGAWIAALFHLMTHAFFKAMLFLGSGQVIEGCHHEQDILKMGGLRKKMPVTCWTFFLGVLAIAGFGIPGTHFGLGGFFSKDEILAVAYERAFNWEGHAEESDAAAGPAGNHVELAADHGQGAGIHYASSVLAMNEPESHGDPKHEANPTNHEAGAEAAEGGAHGHEHGTPEKMAIAAKVSPFPKWLFAFPIIIAYVTPFYMMRVWWLTFMGKPRDHHIYDHAHESPLMYMPLVALAIGTVFCSYWVFRPMLADAAAVGADAAAVVAIDGEAHALHDVPGQSMLTLSHEGGKSPHDWLFWGVGFSWVIGMGLAALLYLNGTSIAARIKRGFGPLATFVENKYYIDHAYNAFLVMGVRAVGVVCYAFDKIFVDGAVNFAAFAAKGIGTFAGRQLDMPVQKHDIGLVDKLANGMANAIYDLGSAIRRPQNGRIRTYVTLAAGAVAVALLCVLFADQIGVGFERLKQSIFMADSSH